MKLLNQINNPVSAMELAQRNSMDKTEVYRVLRGLQMADLVTKQSQSSSQTVIAISSEQVHAQRLNEFFKNNGQSVNGKTVRDLLAVKLLLRRVRPDPARSGRDPA